MTGGRVRSKWIGSLLMVLVLTFLAWFYIRQMETTVLEQTRQRMCAADLIVNNFNCWRNSYIGTALMMLDILLLLRNDFRYTNLLAYGSRKRLFQRQSIRIVIHGTVYGLYFAGCTLLFSMPWKDAQINWNEIDSYFFQVNKCIANVSFMWLALAFVLSLILCWILLGMGYLVLHWFLQSEILVWISVFLCRFAVYQMLHFKWIAGIAYQSWIDGVVLYRITVTALLIVILYAAGTKTARERQFYAERK